MQNERPFKFGDVVTFKSGGPTMTVVMAKPGEWIHCDWFDTSGVYHNQIFHPATLSLSTAQEDRPPMAIRN